MTKASIYLFLITLSIASCGQNGSNAKSNSMIKLNFITIDMLTLPSTDDPIVLRTDFSNDKNWIKICGEIVTPDPEFGFIPHVVFANNISFQDYKEEQLITDSASKYNHAFIFIVDKITITNPEHPILCIGLKHNRGLKLRIIPSEMWGIENNLSISNMDFETFSDAVDKDGIFRGFKY